MVELTNEEMAAIKELTSAYKSGKDIGELISQRLYEELSTKTVDDIGNVSHEKRPGFDEQMSVYESLSEKGLLSSYQLPMSFHRTFDGLTSLGRCYLEDREAELAARKKELRSERIHDYKVACFSFVGGAAAGGIVSYVMHVQFGF